MKSILAAAFAVCVGSGFLAAQDSAAHESLSAWPYIKDISAAPGLSVFALDGPALDKARFDAADLRLYDASGREIPYVLRVRRDVETQSLFTSREFNRAVEGGASIVSCDLGPQPQEHNEVLIATAGNNFRRLAEVQGSADGAQWSTLASQAILFRFSAGGRSAEQQSVSYPVSRYRYVRVRVERDPQMDRAAPEITSLSVRRSIREKGETVQFAGAVDQREAEPMQGRPSSVWRIDLRYRVPIQSLWLNLGEGSFSRPFQLEIVDDPAAPVVLASGDLTRNGDTAVSAARIDFGEQFARHLKLTIIDDRNPPLSFSGVTALSAMRQVLFESAGAIRLYYGNPKAIAPHYDIGTRLAFDTRANNVMPGPERANPIYRPEPKPLSERSPWLVYVVLSAACVLLAAMLVNLVRHSAAAGLAGRT